MTVDENRPILGGGVGVMSANVGDGLGHSELMKLKTVRVFLDDLLVWYSFEEGGDSLFKFFGVTLSPRVSALGTIKGVSWPWPLRIGNQIHPCSFSVQDERNRTNPAVCVKGHSARLPSGLSALGTAGGGTFRVHQRYLWLS
jgi:hypothetical protein